MPTVVAVTDHVFPSLVTQQHRHILPLLSAVFQDHELVLHGAKISTIGERAEDFFMLTGCDQQPLTEEQQEKLKEKLTNELNPPQDLG